MKPTSKSRNLDRETAWHGGADTDCPRVLEHGVFLDALAGLRSLCRRHSRPLSIVILQLDRFRDGDERYPPAFDDGVLPWFASILKTVCRGSDLVARYPGDRFVVALPESEAQEAHELVNRCGRTMREAPVVIGGRPFPLTTSVGIAESTMGFLETEQQLIQRARMALDQARQQGGDRISVWSELRSDQPSPRDSRWLTIDGIAHWVEHLRQQIRSTCMESTQALVAAVEAKDPYTRAHSLTVATYAETIGQRLHLPPHAIETLRAAALLHDVGKIGIPDAILTKPGPLTEQEFDVMKRHPNMALDILRHVSFLADERPFILHHHERYDGRGYPTGLAGHRIPIGARILAVADALDTMLSPRTYKQPYAIDQVREELRVNVGRQFDPAVTEVTLRWLDDTPSDFPQRHIP